MKTTPETEEQLRAMIEETKASLEPLIMEQPDELTQLYQVPLARKHGTPRQFARAVVNAIGEISVDEAKAAIAEYRNKWNTPVTTEQNVDITSLLFRETIRDLSDKIREGLFVAFKNGMHRDVMLESAQLFGGAAMFCAKHEATLRAAIKPCGVADCTCHEMQNKFLDKMIEVNEVATSHL